MAIVTGSSGHMHFVGAGNQEIQFGRVVSQLYLTTAAGASISFDGGTTYMTLANATHTFQYPHVKTIFMQGGTWSGVGIAV